MMKQITWDDQWIGYDDLETAALKKKWASGFCFGGTMIWSVDFELGNERSVPHSIFSDIHRSILHIATMTTPTTLHQLPKMALADQNTVALFAEIGRREE